MLLLLICVFAQRNPGAVTDPRGGALARASVTITEVVTGWSHEVTTNAPGNYVRPALNPGGYAVMADTPGVGHVAEQNAAVYGKGGFDAT